MHLLPYQNLATRKQILQAANGIYLEGTIRAVMEAQKCTVDDAICIMDNLELQELPTKKFYQLLQKWIGERVLVEKTPGNASRIEALYNIENWFDEPLYVILVRHPLATINSMLQYDKEFFHHFDLGVTSEKNLRYNELTWALPYYNILQFMEKIPRDRYFIVRFEDLLQKQQHVMENICQFLKIDFCEEVLQPYQNKQHKMLDGIKQIEFAVGDHKFHQYRSIHPEVATAWKASSIADLPLSDISWEIARKFGYTK
ncbi:hypothetical protein UABAM_00001 [Candidatus Uabimicrobium amorphum]|uniref:Sulfotransferase domain-containing protein n=1 Tax=Uabimicrobium amorphum TaxID=2596890 RepID=A0A5S9F0S4_UABAM|nr:hypothetical protein UABAM_00001 [Candidatus Uabimicrobium amorphum]